MPIVIDEVITDVTSRSATESPAASGAQGGESRPADFDEMRKRLERAFRLAARLAAD